jgi:hypothetical protein
MGSPGGLRADLGKRRGKGEIHQARRTITVEHGIRRGDVPVHHAPGGASPPPPGPARPPARSGHRPPAASPAPPGSCRRRLPAPPILGYRGASASCATPATPCSRSSIAASCRALCSASGPSGSLRMTVRPGMSSRVTRVRSLWCTTWTGRADPGPAAPGLPPSRTSAHGWTHFIPAYSQSTEKASRPPRRQPNRTPGLRMPAGSNASLTRRIRAGASGQPGPGASTTGRREKVFYTERAGCTLRSQVLLPFTVADLRGPIVIAGPESVYAALALSSGAGTAESTCSM